MVVVFLVITIIGISIILGNSFGKVIVCLKSSSFRFQIMFMSYSVQQFKCQACAFSCCYHFIFILEKMFRTNTCLLSMFLFKCLRNRLKRPGQKVLN